MVMCLLRLQILLESGLAMPVGVVFASQRSWSQSSSEVQKLRIYLKMIHICNCLHSHHLSHLGGQCWEVSGQHKDLCRQYSSGKVTLIILMFDKTLNVGELQWFSRNQTSCGIIVT